MQEGMFSRAADLESRNLPFAIVTIIGTEGTVPRKSGRMLVAEDGSFWSTVGGHLIEDAAVREAQEAIREGRNRQIDVPTGKGRMRLMIDVVSRAKRVYIMGFGHVGRELAGLLHKVGFAVYLYDIKPFSCDFAAECHVAGTWKEALGDLVLDQWSAFIITVHSSEDILSYVDASRAFYVGYMGSRSKIIPDRSIHAPAGLDIHAETPAEVAVAITAEIMRSFHRASGLSLNERRFRLVAVIGDDERTARKLHNAGYDVLVLASSDLPWGVWISSPDECFQVFDDDGIPVLADPGLEAVRKLRPYAVVTADAVDDDIAPLVVHAGEDALEAVDHYFRKEGMMF